MKTSYSRHNVDMCNLYVPPEPDDIRLYFGVQIPIDIPYDVRNVAPLKNGPYVKAQGACAVGQWGLVPANSASRKPTRTVPRKNGPKQVPMSTNNLRTENIGKLRTVLGPVWKSGQRCLIPAWSYDEPYWGHKDPGTDNEKNIWWRFRRQDGAPWALAGVWNDWIDKATGEVVPSYSMLTMNCDSHRLLKLMHKPERHPDGAIKPPHEQDKRSVVPIERADWDAWLHGTPEQAQALIQLPAFELFAHGAANLAQQVELPIED